MISRDLLNLAKLLDVAADSVVPPPRKLLMYAATNLRAHADQVAQMEACILQRQSFGPVDLSNVRFLPNSANAKPPRRLM
jgi:hypothetical protein